MNEQHTPYESIRDDSKIKRGVGAAILGVTIEIAGYSLHNTAVAIGGSVLAVAGLLYGARRFNKDLEQNEPEQTETNSLITGN